MKAIKYLTVLIALLLAGNLPAAHTWVVGSGGAATNGGGYDPAIHDFSGELGALHNGSGGPVDVISAGTVTNAGDGDLHIAKTGAFDGAAVGMLCYCDFAATYTDGYYPINTVDAADNYIEITGPSWSADTTVDVNVGGFFSTLTDAEAALVAGGKIQVASNLTLTDTITFNATSGSAIAPMIIEGVNSDGTIAAGDNRPLIDASGSSANYAFTVATSHYVFRNLRVKPKSTSGTNTGVFNPSASSLNCIIRYVDLVENATRNNVTFFNSYNLSTLNWTVSNCRILNIKQLVYSNGDYFGSFDNCYIDCDTVNTSGYMVRLFNCVVKIATRGIYPVAFSNYGRIILVGNTLIGDGSTTLFQGGTYPNDAILTNNLIVGFSDLFNSTSGDSPTVMSSWTGNVMYSCEAYTFPADAVARITHDPFIDAANGDYRLNPAMDQTDYSVLYRWQTGKFAGALGPGGTVSGSSYGPKWPAASDVISGSGAYGWKNEYTPSGSGGGGTVRKPRPVYLGN